jgi:hypothetical protein
MSDSAISLAELLTVYQSMNGEYSEKEDGGSKTTRSCEPERKENIHF